MRECERAKAKVYRAAGYVRLSDKEGDKESESIVNQTALIEEYAEKLGDVELVGIYKDDGVSGVFFDRPGFTRLQSDIEAKKIDCIIVKDLSRLGREYSDTTFLTVVCYSRLGVRLIAINDGVDTANARASDDLLIKFKNIINDSYSADISMKTRSNLRVKMGRGDYVGAYAPYGYKKHPENKNVLIPDEDAGEVVREIFALYIKGCSPARIAKILTQRHIPPPYDYKTLSGINYRNPQKLPGESAWNPVTLKRILTNPVYVGHVVQGRCTTPNHKVKKRIYRGEDELFVALDMHEPIVSADVFELARELCSKDTRAAQGSECVFPLSGYVFCAGCGQNMVRKKVRSGGKAYDYYICSTHKAGLGCAPHRVRADALEASALATLKALFACTLRMEDVLSEMELLSREDLKTKALRARLELCDNRHAAIARFRMCVYESFRLGDIEEEFCNELLRGYRAEERILKRRMDQALSEIGERNTEGPLERLRLYGSLSELSRQAVVSLIESVEVEDKAHIHITPKFCDVFRQIGG